MKFYYEDKLIRTSKTHVYTHALIGQNGKAITAAQPAKDAKRNFSEDSIILSGVLRITKTH